MIQYCITMSTTREVSQKPPDFGWGQIYMLTAPNGKRYIGQTKKYCSGGKIRGIETRWKQHVNDARLYKEGKKKLTCTHLVHAINKHGPENFTREVLLECKLELLNHYETSFIEEYQTTNPQKGYNIYAGGTGTWQKRSENFADNLQKMIEGRRVQKYVEMTQDEKVALKTFLESCVTKFPPGHNKKDKHLPNHVRYFDCNRGYPGYKVQVPDHPVKTFRSGFTRSLDHALKEALEYFVKCFASANDA